MRVKSDEDWRKRRLRQMISGFAIEKARKRAWLWSRQPPLSWLTKLLLKDKT